MRTGVDRTPQALPVPLGGLRVTRRARMPGPVRLWWRRHGGSALVCLGLAAAASGAALALAGRPAEVYAVGSTIHVAGRVLTLDPSHSGGDPRALLYRGDAALVVVELPGGRRRAAASTVEDGRPAIGVCDLWPRSEWELEETCTFSSASGRRTADDRLSLRDGGGWRRRYGDGREVSIAVPPAGSAVPVPFPIGG